MKLKLNDSVDKFTDLYELIHHFATGEQVKNLLRQYKQGLPPEAASDVRLTAQTTWRLCNQNLRTAVLKNHVPIEKVFDLLRDCEENGAQHIFLFKPKNAAAKAQLNDAQEIAKQLIGKKWKTELPSTEVQENDFSWADFRLVGEKGWLAKAYLHSIGEEKTESVMDENDENVRWVKYVKFQKRSICMVVWSAELSLLQIRISNDLDIPLVHSMFEDRLKKRGVELNSLIEPLELGAARANLLAKAEENRETYECGAFRSIDKEMYRIEGSPYTQDPEEPPVSSTFAKNILMKIAQSPEIKKYQLVVYWKTPETAGKTNLRCEIGTRANTHEVVVNARTSPENIDYVLKKLIAFSK